MNDEDIDALTVQWEEGGTVVVEEIEKRVLSNKGGWVTMAFLARERERGSEHFDPAKVMIRRYRKRAKGFEVTAKIVLTIEQAGLLEEALTSWIPRGE